MSTSTNSLGGVGDATQRVGAEERSEEQLEQLRQAVSNCLETTNKLLSELDDSSFPAGKFPSFLRDQLTAGQLLFEHFSKQLKQPDGSTHSLHDISAYVQMQQQNNALNKEDISYLRAVHEEMEALSHDIERLQQQAEAQRQIKSALPTEALPSSLENQIEERVQQLSLFGDGLRSLSSEIETLSLEEQREQGQRRLGQLKINVKKEEALLGPIQAALENRWTVMRDLHEQITEMKALQDRLTSLEPTGENDLLKNALALDLKALKAYQERMKNSPTDSNIECIKADLEYISMKLPEGQLQIQTLSDRPIFVGDRVGAIGDKTYYAAHMPKGAKERPLIGVPTDEIPKQLQHHPTLNVVYTGKTPQFHPPVEQKRGGPKR